MVPALWLVSALIFALAEIVPGDVARTILGPYATPAGAIPPSGRQVAFESVDIVEISAGRIASWRVYLDTAAMMAQLAASPAMASA